MTAVFILMMACFGAGTLWFGVWAERDDPRCLEFAYFFWAASAVFGAVWIGWVQ